MTRGTSSLEAADVVRDAGAVPVLIAPLVDRGGTCAAMCAAAGIAFQAVVTAPQLGFAYEGGA
jgi:orotate phosphoribosyltransferase